MIEKLKDVNLDLFESYNSSILMWRNRNKGVYVFLQQFLELFIKHIIKEAKKSNYIEPKSGLGALLNNRYVIDYIKYDLKISDADFRMIEKINKSGNDFKHESYSIEYLENDVLEYIAFNYEFTAKYFKHIRNIDIEKFDSAQFVRTDEDLFKHEVASIKQTKVESILKSNATKIEMLTLENNRLISENDILNVLESKVEDKDQYEELKSEFAKLTSQVENLKDKIDEQPDDLQLEYEFENLTIELDEIEEELRKYKNRIILTKDIALQRNTAVINENTDLIKEYQELNKKIKKIDSSGEDDVYSDMTLVLENFKISYDSCYIGTTGFSITNLIDDDVNTSRYCSYYATIYNQLIRGSKIEPSQYLKSLELRKSELVKIYKLQISILALIRNGVLRDENWRINLINSSISYLNIAIGDIQNRMSQLLKLSNMEYVKPNIELTHNSYTKGYANISFDVIYPNKSNCYSIVNKFDMPNLSNLWISEKIRYDIKNTSDHLSVLNELLLEFFRFENFRPGQLEILINTLNGHNTIGILTTSGGKSLIYQFAALMQPKLTIIVDPINALISDQYRKIKEDFKIDRVVKLIAHKKDDISYTAREAVDKMFLHPSIYIFCSPERFQNARFRDWLIAQSIKKKIGLIVLDEVHCLSEWGHDFRIPYLMLSHTINTYCSNIQYLGLTATAAINVIKDLQVELGIFEKENIVFSRKLQRENLSFFILKSNSFSQMEATLNTVLKKDYESKERSFKLPSENPKAEIVFFKTKTTLNQMYHKYLELYPNEITFFNGDEKSTQDAFIHDDKTLLFATKAFGMGIDKPNVRRTIHFGIPQSREAFFQEAGRAGRDGEPSRCLLLTFESNQSRLDQVNRFLNLSTDTQELIKLQKNIGYSDENDLSTIAYFMVQDIDTPEQEAIKTLRFLKSIERYLDALQVQYTTTSKELHSTQSLLYILHKIGIIRTWTVEYDYNQIHLHITFHPEYKDIEYIKQTSINYLNQYVPNIKLVNQIELVNEYSEIDKIIIIIREWYQATFLRSKREQLANMFDFVERYKNKANNDAIQNEMSQFFDISRLLEKRESKTSLTFEGVQLKVVLQRASKLRKAELQEMRVTMERLLETEESEKINLFMSLIMLRLDSFNTRNGKDRLTKALNSSDENDVVDFYKNLKKTYTLCSDTSKKEIIEYAYNYNQQYFMEHLFNEDYVDEHISPYLVKGINSRYSEIF